MGGTSTDVALVQNLTPRTGRETKVGDLTVRASSVDVRTVGAGGGSIAHVPQLTKALRVGPQSAGAVPGPAAYGLGGTEPTVTDANVVLGYLPTSLAGGEITLDLAASRAAVQTVADAMGLESVEVAAAGIIDIVNENMLGGLRLVSVQQGFDPRQFALVAFGGAGPLHANAIGKLTGAWPVIVPPSPGVLCALGDATTSLRDESARTILRRFSDLSGGELHEILTVAVRRVRRPAGPAGRRRRPSGHPTTRSTSVTSGRVSRSPSPSTRRGWTTWTSSLTDSGSAFDTEHERLFSFLLGTDHELVNASASVNGPRPEIAAIAAATRATATRRRPDRYLEGLRGGRLRRRPTSTTGSHCGPATSSTGPAIVVEMDSTTLVLPGHAATTHAVRLPADPSRRPRARAEPWHMSSRPTPRRWTRRTSTRSPST